MSGTPLLERRFRDATDVADDTRTADDLFPVAAINNLGRYDLARGYDAPHGP